MVFRAPFLHCRVTAIFDVSFVSDLKVIWGCQRKFSRSRRFASLERNDNQLLAAMIQHNFLQFFLLFQGGQTLLLSLERSSFICDDNVDYCGKPWRRICDFAPKSLKTFAIKILDWAIFPSGKRRRIISNVISKVKSQNKYCL